MAEHMEPTQDRIECSAAPDTLHIDLPPANPENVFFAISNFVVQILTEHRENLLNSLVFCELLTSLGFSCMDLIQTLAEAILDVILPQVYTHMRTHGTFSPTILGVTEDRIQAYMGDSIGQALNRCLQINVQDLESTKVFTELVVKHISKTVNSVLALTTQTPLLESILPVVFISGSVSFIRDLKFMVSHISNLLTEVLNPTSSLDKSYEKEHSPRFSMNSKRDLKKMLSDYIIRMVRVLKLSQRPPNRINSSNHRDICIRVSTNTKILTVEESESHGREPAMDSNSDFDSLPGAVPDTDKSKSPFKSCPFSSVTVIRTTEDSLSHLMMEKDTITNIADELVEVFLNDLGEAADTVASQKTALQLEDVDKEKIRRFTQRIFKLVMSGHDYQIPFVPGGTLMCDTVTYRRLRSRDITNLGIITHALYLRTEEVVTRCAVEVLLWLTLCLRGPDSPSPTLSNISDLFIQGPETGDFITPEESFSNSSQSSNATVVPGTERITQSQTVGNILLQSLLTLLAGDLYAAIGIRNSDLFDLLVRVGQHIGESGFFMPDHFHISLWDQSCKDIYQSAFSDLLLKFGSLQAMQEAAEDFRFDEDLISALMEQLRSLDEPLVSHEKSAKKTICGFLKKVKKRCCKTTSKKATKATTVSFLTTDENDSELQEDFRKEEPPKEQTKQRLCPLMCRTAACIRKKCSKLRKRFSAITRAVCRPFIACISQESE